MKKVPAVLRKDAEQSPEPAELFGTLNGPQSDSWASPSGLGGATQDRCPANSQGQVC